MITEDPSEILGGGTGHGPARDGHRPRSGRGEMRGRLPRAAHRGGVVDGRGEPRRAEWDALHLG